MKITLENITKLKKNEIFVFGSNENGSHLGGAAKLALDKFGAENGNPLGIQGQSFAIPTLDKQMQKCSLSVIKDGIDVLATSLKLLPKKHFILTEIGCGIAGFEVYEIAPLFKEIFDSNPSNMSWPQCFVDRLEMGEVISGFKGTDKNMQCRGFQYEVDKEYKHQGVVRCCDQGFHLCENPLDVLSYYKVANGNRYFTAMGYGKTHKENSDSKVACSKIRIGVEVNLESLTKAAVKFIFEKTKVSPVVSATSGDNSHSATSGDNSHSATSGKYAHSATSGYNSHSATSGDNSHSATSGNNSHSATSGNNSHSATSGKYANSATSGKYANSATSGEYANSATSGDNSHSATSGKYANSATSGKYAHSATSGDNANSATSGYNSHSATSGKYANSATSGDNSHSAISGKYAHSATSGDNSHSATSGKYANSATSGDNSHSATSGDNSHSATSGNNSHSATSGKYAHSATSGKYANSATSGKYANSATSGEYAHSATSGDNSHSATSGKYANSATSGKYAHSATSGKYANSATSGYNSHSATVGESTVAAAVNAKSSAKASIGCWIVVSEWVQDKEYNWNVKEVKAFQVDGVKIKANQYYTLKNGEPVETGESGNF